MKRFLNWCVRRRATNSALVHRPHLFRPQLEQLDERLVPAAGLSSAISIPHSFWLNGHLISWTERDWYSVDRNTGQLVEFQGTSRVNLGGPTGIRAVSTSVDPRTGYGEVFVSAYDHSVGLTEYDNLWLCDSYNHWHFLDLSNTDYIYSSSISATRDGHVYAVTYDRTGINYVDSYGNWTYFVGPQGNHSLCYDVAAGVSQFGGGNEVFAIWGAAIYVNSANDSWHWALVDNSHTFGSISAAGTDTVFATDVIDPDVHQGAHVYEVTLQFQQIGWIGYWVWSEQDITGGLVFYKYGAPLSADTDAAGNPEVYAIDGYSNAYLYRQGSWTFKDSDVVDIAAAGSGYFYDVNYDYGNYVAWEWDPNRGGWAFVGDNLS